MQAASPGKEAGLGLVAVTVIVKSEGAAVPPLSLMTSLHTVSWGGMSLLVMVQAEVPPGEMAMVTQLDSSLV